MESSVDDPFSLGQLIAGTPYRVRGLIGSGGMGSVYEVEHEELGKLFVLKALRPQLVDRADLAARMKNEWRALGRLQHPNIVVVTDAGRTASGVPYYVMERLEGETLSARLRRDGAFSLPAALRLTCGILDALAAAHAIGIVHRDIKPPNVFLPSSGGVKLLDFGIAKLSDQAAKVVTHRGVAIGTPKYMSPEQAEGRPVDGRADLYAVALVLFELLAGRGPFAHHRDPNELVLAHIAEIPPRLDQVCPGVPAEVADLVQRWLSKDPANRPLDAGVAAREIRRLAAGFSIDEETHSPELTAPPDSEAATRGVEPQPDHSRKTEPQAAPRGPLPGGARGAKPSGPARPLSGSASGTPRIFDPGASVEPSVTRTVAVEPPAPQNLAPAPAANREPSQLREARSDARPRPDTHPEGETSLADESNPGRRSETPPPIVPAPSEPRQGLPWARWAALSGGTAALTFVIWLLGGGASESGAPQGEGIPGAAVTAHASRPAIDLDGARSPADLSAPEDPRRAREIQAAAPESLSGEPTQADPTASNLGSRNAEEQAHPGDGAGDAAEKGPADGPADGPGNQGASPGAPGRVASPSGATGSSSSSTVSSEAGAVSASSKAPSGSPGGTATSTTAKPTSSSTPSARTTSSSGASTSSKVQKSTAEGTRGGHLPDSGL